MNQYDNNCSSCNGEGKRMYSNTSTWRGGIAGQAMTMGVCDKCWGSGDEERPWPSWRETEKKIRNLKAAVGTILGAAICHQCRNPIGKSNPTFRRHAVKLHPDGDFKEGDPCSDSIHDVVKEVKERID